MLNISWAQASFICLVFDEHALGWYGLHDPRYGYMMWDLLGSTLFRD